MNKIETTITNGRLMSDMSKPQPIYGIAVDGPADQPNGTLLVQIIRPSSRRHAWVCKVIKVVSRSAARLPAPGATLTVDRRNLNLHWLEE